MTGSTEKRLFHYALLYKKDIMIGIICLIFATVLELTGPFIAKVIIDDHILGVEGVCEDVDASHEHGVVTYEGSQYISSNRLEDTNAMTYAVTILAVVKKYYLVIYADVL